MSLGGLIPIGGAGGGGGGKKANAPSDLTSGLISITGLKGGGGGGGLGDLDMSDFDVDDLLADNVGGASKSSSKSKSKTKSASPSPPKDSSSSKKKKSSSSSSKSKDKDKSSSSSSKKKPKSKTKDSALSAFDDSADNFDDNTDDWSGSNKAKTKSRWDDDSAEFTSPPMKKKGALDAEFAKMLGLDDDFGVSAASASGDVDGSDRHERSVASRDDAASEQVSSVSAFGSRADDTEPSAFSYEPRVRGGGAGSRGREKPVDAIGSDLFGSTTKRGIDDLFAIKSSSAPIGNDDEDKRANADGGLSAAFFQSDSGRNGDDDDDTGGASSLSFLSSGPSERRGGARGGGRRGGAASAASTAIDDPFASAGSVRGGGSDLFGARANATATPSSALDSLFSGASRATTRERDGDRDDTTHGLDAKTASRHDEPDAIAGPRIALGGRRSGSARDRLPAHSVSGSDDLLAELFPSEAIAATSTSQSKSLSSKPAPIGSTSSAKDDLLAELFPSEPQSLISSRTAKPVVQPAQTSPEPTKKSTPTPAPTGTLSNTAKDELLADLLPSLPQPQVPTSRRERAADNDVGSSSTITKQQNDDDDDVLADLLPPSMATARSNTAKSEQATGTSKPANVTTTSVASTTARGLTDISSARDSLLLGLLPASPPKPSVIEPRRPSITPTVSPAKERSVSPSKSSPSKSPQRSPLRVDTSTSFVTAAAAASAKVSEPPVSPGRAKTLASPSAGSINAFDFELSKDSLLEELLAPPTTTPLASPSSALRRISYSQSFEYDSVDDRGNRDATADSPSRQRSKPSGSGSSTDKANAGVSSSSMPLEPAASPLQQSAAVNTQQHLSAAQTATELAAAAEQRASELAAAGLQQREHELRVESDALRVALTATHASECAELQRAIDTLTQQLANERAVHAALELQHQQLNVSAANATQQCAMLTQQNAQLQRERLETLHELHALRAEHATCEPQRALFESERAGFVSQTQALEAQTRTLVVQLSAAKQETQAAQLALASAQQAAQQEMQLQTQRDAHQMQRLHAQLQTSLVSLTMLQEQTAETERTQHEVESSARLRMISTLETSSRQCARTAEDECKRLASLLTSLEATLRHARTEQLEEKERLRHEQQRLSVLASHFQAQSTVLHESAESNAQVLASHLTASMQSVRVAEARLAARREALDDAERTLYDDRTRFAVYREEWLATQARDAHALQRAQQQLDVKSRALERERDDLDAVIASHEDDFAALQHETRALQHERERIEHRAQQVSDAAAALETLTRELLMREDAVARERDDAARQQRECAAQLQGVASDKHKLDARELRLHAQFKQMEQARRRLNDQRQQHLATRNGSKASIARPLVVHDLEQAKKRLLAHTQYMGARSSGTTSVNNNYSNNNNNSTAPTVSAVDNNSKWRTPASSVSASNIPSSNNSNNEPPDWHDPSGLSPAFRQLVEDNWRQREQRSGLTDAALHKERMWISCIGLDTTPVRGADDDLKAAPSSSGSAKHHYRQQQQQRHAAAAPTKADNNEHTNSMRASSMATPNTSSRTAGARPPLPPPSQSVSGTAAKRTVTIDL